MSETKRIRAVAAPEPARALEILGELEGLAPQLAEADCLEAIGEAARLSALLAARYLILAACRVSAPTGNLLDAKAVAERLCVPASAVYRYARMGALPAVRSGQGTVRFDSADVEKFIRGRRTS